MNNKNNVFAPHAVGWFYVTTGFLFIFGILSFYIAVTTSPENESNIKLLYTLAGLMQLVLAVKIWGQKGAVGLGIIGLIYFAVSISAILLGSIALLLIVKLFIFYWIFIAFAAVGITRIIIASHFKMTKYRGLLSICGVLSIVNVVAFLFLLDDNQLIRLVFAIELIIGSIYLYFMSQSLKK